MPCFRGLAVSIHSQGDAIQEYSIQKQTRLGRINSYIPVPSTKVPERGTQPEPATFAISITLLTPGLPIPYSTGKPTPDHPNPLPKTAGGFPGCGRSGAWQRINRCSTLRAAHTAAE